MINSTSEIQKIKVCIEKSLNDKSVLAILFRDVENNLKYPQIVASISLVGTQYGFTGLFPIEYFGKKFIIDVNEILGCANYNITSFEYEKIVLEYIQK